MHGRGHVWQGGMHSRVWGMHGRGGRLCVAEGVCVAGEHVWQGACVAGGVAGEMVTEVGSMHPTGMHSYFGLSLFLTITSFCEGCGNLMSTYRSRKSGCTQI